MPMKTISDRTQLLRSALAGLLLAAGVQGPLGAQTIRVLGIDTGSSWDYDTIPRLTGVTFTEVTVSAFASVNLDLYDVLMVSETFSDVLAQVPSQATLDALQARETDLANWLAAGHGIFATCEPCGSRRWGWMPDAIQPAVGAFMGADLLSIVQPAHPVMVGLTSGGLSGWNESSHGNFLTSGGLTALVTVSGGSRPITLAGTYGLGRIVITDQDPDYHLGGSTGQMVALVQNAIHWVAGRPQSPPSYRLYGTGCQGSAGIPALGPAPGQLPWIGTSFALRATNLPGAAGAIVLLGRSRTSWPPLTLPLDLGPTGMTGCTLYCSGQLILPLPNASGVGSLNLDLPADPALLGASFFNQALIADFSANPAGITASNAGEGRIGGQ